LSQNRQAARDRLAASLDYEINLKAEIEIMALHDKLDRILTPVARMAFKIGSVFAANRAAFSV
jgi:uncharacterized membrane protein